MTAADGKHACTPARRGMACAMALICLGLIWACSARADGDPASDALISENVFYPYSSPVPQSDQDTLNRRVSEVHRAGLALKVAIIARASDLGSITALYRAPQRYAAFLDTEISFKAKQPLLVVMPDGFGVEGLPVSDRRAVREADPPRGTSGGALAAAAGAAITSILRGTGRSSASSTTGSRHSPDVLLAALILAALLVIAALVVQWVFFRPQAP